MSVQLKYIKGLAAGLPGLLYDFSNTRIESRAAETIIPFGVFVDRGTLPNQALLGTANSIGVAVRIAKENTLTGTTFTSGQYEVTETVGILRSGEIWAQFDTAGGTVGALVTINASGQVVAAGGGVVLAGITAIIEGAAIDATQDATSVFIGRIKVNG